MCRSFRKDVKDIGPVCIISRIEQEIGLTFAQHHRNLLRKHVRLAYQLNAMTRASDAFITEFEKTKCVLVDNVYLPVKFELAGCTCRTINMFRGCCTDTILGKMIAKLLKDALDEICHGVVSSDGDPSCQQTLDVRKHIALVSVLHLLYEVPSGHAYVLSERMKDSVPGLQKRFDCTRSVVQSWMAAQSFWVPSLSADSAISYTDTDLDQIDGLLNCVQSFVNSYRHNMNRSRLFQYSQYRRELQYTRRQLQHLKKSVLKHAVCPDTCQKVYVYTHSWLVNT